MWRENTYAAMGRGHADCNIPCQDKVHYMNDRGVWAIALADGAGSAALSHYGAEATVKSVCRLLTSHFDEFYSADNASEVSSKIIGAIRKRLTGVRKKRKCEMRDLASTLLAVAVKDERFLMIHLGDGAIGYLKNGEVLTASQPTNGEYANSTVFTTSSSASHKMRFYRGNVRNVDGFILMSDGAGESLYSKGDKAVRSLTYPFFLYGGLFSGEVMQEFLKATFDDVVTQVTRDDCSVAMLVRESAFAGIRTLRTRDKMTIFGLEPSRADTRRRIRHYEHILELLAEGKGASETAAKLHFKKRIMKKKLAYLEECGLIRKEGNHLQLLAAY